MTDVNLNDILWHGLSDIFSSYNFKTIGVGVHNAKYRNKYPELISNSEYNIALRIIMENFVHFLDAHNAKGTVYLESVNPTEDQRLVELYYNIINDGTLFINKAAFQRRLSTINFQIKSENNIGLQIADFIPNPFNRKYSGCKDKTPSLLDLIESKLYDGGGDLKGRFGFKIIE